MYADFKYNNMKNVINIYKVMYSVLKINTKDLPAQHRGQITKKNLHKIIISSIISLS